MSDDLWRNQGDADDDWDDFGELSFADDPRPGEEPVPLSFGSDDTGALPHWSEPATGELPSLFGDREPTDDLDVWSAIAGTADAPDDLTVADEFDLDLQPAPAPVRRAPEADFDLDEPPPPPRQRESIRIGTDPTGEAGRPRPERGRDGRPLPPSGPRPGARAAGGAEPAAPGGVSGRNMPMAIALGLGLAAGFVLLTRFLGTTGGMIIVVAALVLAAIEFFDKATERGYRPAKMPGVIGCALMPLAAYWQAEQGMVLVAALTMLAAVVTAMGANGVQSGPLPNTAITMLGVVWIGLLGSYAAMILKFGEPIGTDTLYIVVIGVVANDVGALFVGSAAGRTPLRGWISPNKSVEGLIGGIVLTVVALVLVGVVNGEAQTWPNIGHLITAAVVISVLAPIGDLTESMFKRNLDIKDFGTILPGHGGVLDRFDGFLFVLPGMYYLLRVLEPFTA